MKIAIYGKKLNPRILNEIHRFFVKVATISKDIFIYEPFATILKANGTEIPDFFSYFDNYENLPENTDILFSIGGDGTILNAITVVKNKNIPILGVNSGKLGFLTTLTIEEFPSKIDLIKNKVYEIENRSLIKINLKDSNLVIKENFALNECATHKGDNSQMITVHTYLDEEYLNSYISDGLIVATPTGSTAYSLSCGGPILMPNVQNFVITPIAPHNLNVRPIVVPDSMSIKLKTESRNEKILISLDTRSYEIPSNSEINISKADFKIKLIRFKNEFFFKTLRNKLFWGIDNRS